MSLSNVSTARSEREIRLRTRAASTARMNSTQLCRRNAEHSLYERIGEGCERRQCNADCRLHIVIRINMMSHLKSSRVRNHIIDTYLHYCSHYRQSKFKCFLKYKNYIIHIILLNFNRILSKFKYCYND